MKTKKVNDLKDGTSTSNRTDIEVALRYWNNMFYRVEHSAKYSTVHICTEWYMFSNFYNWFVINYIENWHLDKDIKSGTLYSPDTCIFVPPEVNLLFRRRKNSTGYYGVFKAGKKFQVLITQNGKTHQYGTFNTESEAHDEAMKVRKARLKELSQKYSGYNELSDLLNKKSM